MAPFGDCLVKGFCQLMVNGVSCVGKEDYFEQLHKSLCN